MPIPATFSDLSTTPASNSPAGTDSPTAGDDNIRTAFAFLASIFGNTGNGWTSPYGVLATANTFTGAQTAYSFIPSSATVPANGMYLPAANTVGIASNTTLRWSVNSTGNHVIPAPTAGVAVSITGLSGQNALVVSGGPIRTQTTLVADLLDPAVAGPGARTFVTDATGTTFGAVPVGLGLNKVPVYCDGTNWRIG